MPAPPTRAQRREHSLASEDLSVAGAAVVRPASSADDAAATGAPRASSRPTSAAARRLPTAHDAATRRAVAQTLHAAPLKTVARRPHSAASAATRRAPLQPMQGVTDAVGAVDVAERPTSREAVVRMVQHRKTSAPSQRRAANEHGGARRSSTGPRELDVDAFLAKASARVAGTPEPSGGVPAQPRAFAHPEDGDPLHSNMDVVSEGSDEDTPAAAAAAAASDDDDDDGARAALYEMLERAGVATPASVRPTNRTPAPSVSTAVDDSVQISASSYNFRDIAPDETRGPFPSSRQRRAQSAGAARNGGGDGAKVFVGGLGEAPLQSNAGLPADMPLHRAGASRVMTQPAVDWPAPSVATSHADVDAALDLFGSERARFQAWAAAAEENRAARVGAQGQAAYVYDTVWCDAMLAQLRVGGPTHTAAGAAVFRALGASFLLGRCIETLVPPSARDTIVGLVEELRDSALFSLNGDGVEASDGIGDACARDHSLPTTTPYVSKEAAELAEAEARFAPSPIPRHARDGMPSRPAASAGKLDCSATSGSVRCWSGRRLASEALHLARLRHARDVNTLRGELQRRQALFDRDVDLLARTVDGEERARMRMVLLAWRGHVRATSMKRRVATTLVNNMADRANKALGQAAFLGFRANAAAGRELRRRKRQLADAQQHEMREAKLVDQISQLNVEIAMLKADHQRAVDSLEEKHWHEYEALKLAHADEDAETARTKLEIARVTDENERLRLENRRWALLTNQCHREIVSAVEKRAPGFSRGHPEVALLYDADPNNGPDLQLPSGANGMPLVQVSPFPSLRDVLESDAPSMRLLLLFANYALRQVLPLHATVENFSHDFADAAAFAAALCLLFPSAVSTDDRANVGSMSAAARADFVCNTLDKVGLRDIVTSTDILMGVELKNMTLAATLLRIFSASNRFGTSDGDVACLDSDGLVGVRRRRRRSSAGSRSSGRSTRSRLSAAETASVTGGDEKVILRRHQVVKFDDVDRVAWRFGDGADVYGNTQTDTDDPAAHDAGGVDSLAVSQRSEASSQASHDVSHDPSIAVARGPAPRVVVNTDITAMEQRVPEAIERARAWQYISELAARDVAMRLHSVRSVHTGEVLDEKGRRFMEWFVDVDENRIAKVAALHEWNAKNEVDRVLVVLQTLYWELRAVYQAYAAQDHGQRMSQAAFMSFLRDTSLVKGMPKSTVDDALRLAVENIDPDESEGQPASSPLSPFSGSRNATAFESSTLGASTTVGELNYPPMLVAFVPAVSEKVRRKLVSPMVNFQLSPQVFLCMLVYIAHHRYQNAVDADDKKPYAAAAAKATTVGEGDAAAAAAPAAPAAALELQQKLPLHRCLKRLVLDDVAGVAASSTVDGQRHTTRHPYVARVFKKNMKPLARAFRAYASTTPQNAADKKPTAGQSATSTDGYVMASDDAVRFCRDCRLVDAKFGVPEVQAIAMSFCSDDDRLMQTCEEARRRVVNAEGQNLTLGAMSAANVSVGAAGAAGATASTVSQHQVDVRPYTVPVEIDCGQPEDRKGQGLQFSDFQDFLCAVIVARSGQPMLHVGTVVAAFFRDVFMQRLKELHV